MTSPSECLKCRTRLKLLLSMLWMRWHGTIYDHRRSPAPAYEVRAKVWLNTQNYMTTCLTKKLDHKWIGSFVIKKVVSPTAIKLSLSPHKQGIHPVISVSNICPYHPDP